MNSLVMSQQSDNPEQSHDRINEKCSNGSRADAPVNTINHKRSSYHLEISYYIYNQKKAEYDNQQLNNNKPTNQAQSASQSQAQSQSQQPTQAQLQSQNQMMLSTVMQNLGHQLNTMQQSGSPSSLNPQQLHQQQPNIPQQQLVSNTNLSTLMQSVKNDGRDINSRVDDLMNS